MSLSFFGKFLSRQLFVKVAPVTGDFKGQTIIVTGSNTGLGLEAARHIAARGAEKVILGVRTIAKGEAAADDIAKTTSIPRSQIEVWQVETNDAESVKAFAKRAEGLKRLDGVVLNAGILNQSSWQFFDGVEAHIAVNVIGTILLAQLLLPTLTRSAKDTGLRGRIAVVGSELEMIGDMHYIDIEGSILKKLNNVAGLKPDQTRYQLSKLLVEYSVKELASRYPVSKTNVIIVDLTPGLCKSDLFRDDLGTVMNFVIPAIGNTIGHTTEEGARSLVYAVAPELPVEAHGAFLWNNQITDPGYVVTSADGQRIAKKWNAELFAELERLAPGCTSVGR